MNSSDISQDALEDLALKLARFAGECTPEQSEFLRRILQQAQVPEVVGYLNPQPEPPGIQAFWPDGALPALRSWNLQFGGG